ncbi:MAG: hypothetical protein KDA58_00310 [Planctomycetaceae bacterium]|nr:hypothetical protein [Planctomycetaceae bacterium]
MKLNSLQCRILGLLCACVCLSLFVPAVMAADRAAEARAKWKAEQAVRERERELAKQQEQAELATFDPNSLPRPEQCFASFLQTTRQARSFDQVLPYLTLSDQQHYQREQQAHTPELVEQRRKFHTESGASAESIAFLTMAPYERGLEHHQRIANSVRKFVSVRVNGKEAKMVVTAQVRRSQNGVGYPYGSATITMVAEEGYWRLAGYSESEVSYSSEEARDEALGLDR